MEPDRRLRWKCRRGMKELDVALERYLVRHYARADEAERGAFEHLLDKTDPELYALLLGRVDPQDKATADVIARIQDPARS